MKGLERDNHVWKGLGSWTQEYRKGMSENNSAEKTRDEAESARLIAEERKIEALKRVVELEKLLQCKPTENK